MTITSDQILKASSEAGQSPRWLLRSPRRDKWIVKDRVAVAQLMRAIGMSWPAIGRELNRDDSSILRAFEKLKDDEDVKETIGKICKRLNLSLSYAEADKRSGVGHA